MSGVRARLGSLRIALSAALLFFAAALSALLAHLAIDALGDVWLADDAYDHLAHGSRALAFFAVWTAALVALILAARAAWREARGSNGALRELLRATLPASHRRHAALVMVGTLLLVVSMEALDALLAGRPTVDLADLLGGSLGLGLGVVTLCALLVTAAVRDIVRRLIRFHRTLVGIVVAFIGRSAQPDCGVLRAAATRPVAARAHSLRLAQRAAGRAPPRFPGAHH
jgi:hypothetical protein